MSWLQEFKAFALKGNTVDLAIAVVIGAAFGKVIDSFVNNIIMPPIGLIIGGVDFDALSFKMHIPGTSQAPVEVKYGAFINTLITFYLIAISIFIVIKVMNKLRKTKAQEAKTKDCPECAMSIPVEAKKCGHCCSKLKS